MSELSELSKSHDSKIYYARILSHWLPIKIMGEIGNGAYVAETYKGQYKSTGDATAIQVVPVGVKEPLVEDVAAHRSLIDDLENDPNIVVLSTNVDNADREMVGGGRLKKIIALLPEKIVSQLTSDPDNISRAAFANCVILALRGCATTT